MPRNDTAVVVWRSSARKIETTATWCLSASIAPGGLSIGQYRGKCTLWGLKLLHFAEPILHCGTVGTQLQRCHSAARGSNLLENAAEWHRCSRFARRNETTAVWSLSATPLCKAVSKAPSNYQSVDKYRGKCTLCGLKLLHFAEPILHSGTVGSNLLQHAARWHRWKCLDVLCRTGLPREIKPPSCGLCLLPLYGKQNGKPQVTTNSSAKIAEITAHPKSSRASWCSHEHGHKSQSTFGGILCQHVSTQLPSIFLKPLRKQRHLQQMGLSSRQWCILDTRQKNWDFTCKTLGLD